MDNTRLKLIIGLIITISLVGCNLIWQRYNNEEYGFSILLPRLWYKEEGLHNTVIIAKSTQKDSSDKFQENINVVVEDLPKEVPINLETFFELNKEETMRVIPGEEFNVSEGEIFAGRVRGKWLSFNSRLRGVTLSTISAVWIKANRVYVVTCSSEYTEFPKYEPTFKRVIHSLRIK